MGILGLTSFINRNSNDYFENYQLKDTLVIIDGFALTNFLYRLYENNTSVFGGDYDIMAKVYVDFINLLLRCNVTPLFIFDGAYEQRKIETIMQRMSQRIQLYAQHNKTNDCMPCFGSHILFDILNDMDIPHINCDFEADAEIVALAKILDCPVISRDSDFYVNVIPYIPLDMIILDLKSTEKYINCRLYRVETLLNRFGGLKIDYLPLMAVLLGNDYIRQDTFASLLALSPGTFNCGLKLRRITNWLRKQNDVNSAINNMINNLNNNKDYIYRQIQTIINEYKNKDSKYLSFVLQFKIMNKYHDSLIKFIKKDDNSILPRWLEHNYRIGTINSEVMTIITMKKIFFKVMIEDYNKPPYYVIAFNIIERIIGLLFGKNHLVQGFGRKNGLNTGNYKLTTYIHKPYVALVDLNKTDIEYRKNIILDLIGTKLFYGVPKEWELFIIILIYWIKETKTYKSVQVHALIICAITLNIIQTIEMESQNKICRDDPTDKSIIEENITKVKKEDCLKAKSILSNYFKVNLYSDKNEYNKIIHSFAQFQCCAHFFMILNSLLDFPYAQCRIEHFFKGSFLYNLSVKLVKERQPELFVTQQLFGKLDSINIVYKSIMSHLDILLSDSKKRVSPGTSNNINPIFKKSRRKTKINQE